MTNNQKIRLAYSHSAKAVAAASLGGYVSRCDIGAWNGAVCTSVVRAGAINFAARFAVSEYHWRRGRFIAAAKSKRIDAELAAIEIVGTHWKAIESLAQRLIAGEKLSAPAAHAGDDAKE